MKKYEEKTRPETKYEQLVETRCDVCGKTTTDEWRTGSFDAVEVVVKLKTGSSYPEGGGGEETTIDICPDCFKTQLVPWVQSKGGEPTKTEWRC